MANDLYLSKEAQAKYGQNSVRRPAIKKADVGDAITHLDTRQQSPAPTRSAESASASSTRPTTARSTPTSASSAKPSRHNYPRYEARVWPDTSEYLDKLHAQARESTHPKNGEINYSEMFNGLIYGLSPAVKYFSFKSLYFKRGRLAGEGPERIKTEIAHSFRQAVTKWVLKALVTRSDADVIEAASRVSVKDRRALVDLFSADFDSRESDIDDDNIAANG